MLLLHFATKRYQQEITEVEGIPISVYINRKEFPLVQFHMI